MKAFFSFKLTPNLLNGSVGLELNFDLMSFQTDFLIIYTFISFSLSFSQVICDQMQRVPGENRPHRVRDAGARVRVPPQLLLLLCMWPTAEERGWVCTEGRTAAVQERLWEGERPPRLCQPRWLRFRYEYRLIYTPQTMMPAYSWIYFKGSFRRLSLFCTTQKKVFWRMLQLFFVHTMNAKTLTFIVWTENTRNIFWNIFFCVLQRKKRKEIHTKV